jgi:Spy/CpxP family protein refolding chaperone
MRPRILMAILCLLVVTAAQAQHPTASDNETKGAHAQDRLAELESRLQLTPEQTAKLRPIIDQETEELRAVRDKYASDSSPTAKQTMRGEMKTIHEKYEGQITAVLTPEQQTEWSKIKEEHKSGAEDRASQAQERLAELQTRLKLTPDQTEKLRPVIQQEMAELKAVKDKYAMDTSHNGRKNMFRDMKKVQEKYSGQIAAVLTPEQQSEWKKIKEERKQEYKEKRGR